MKRKLFKEYLELAINDYNSGMKIPEIGRKYGFNRSTVWLQLKKYVNIRPDNKTHAKRYNLDENYFDNIDTEAKAYFLGLMISDGSNNEEKHNIRINLQEEDKHILDSFLLELKTDNSLRYIDCSKYKNKKNQYRLDIYNKHISQKLCEYGCINNKEFKTYFPKQIPKNLYNHFIRGYFDGDGSIFNNKNVKKLNHKSTYSFNITGNESLLINIQNILCSELKLNKTKIFSRYPDKVISAKHFSYNGNINCIKIRDWLYKDANYYLIRKFEKFQQINKD